ncbi:unnamed protein product [Acanthoscelides obtectus]|uniref:Uncharacterized protein n=1 Tax=Acanthoscelides obtectus TaxID=200917 RepID=A0A9P0QAB3_ACAOB|nr:unnamed protein product [Acanthoscelides obtectus]CAK1630336.1 hypothetical protein AOBTE_LOCUS6268 [Acanthoscelides obtectus]
MFMSTNQRAVHEVIDVLDLIPNATVPPPFVAPHIQIKRRQIIVEELPFQGTLRPEEIIVPGISVVRNQTHFCSLRISFELKESFFFLAFVSVCETKY